MQDVAILDDIVLALGAHLAGFLGRGLAAAGDIVVIGNGLGADETLLEITMDDAGGLRGGPAFADRPGAGFLRAGGEIGLQAQQ